MVDYRNPRAAGKPVRVVAFASAVCLVAAGVGVGRWTADEPRAVVDTECRRGDEALAAAAAGHLAVLVPQLVAGRQATEDAARSLGAASDVVDEFGRWAAREVSGYRHSLFGATAVKVEKREGDRALVSVDGYWLRSSDTANGSGEFTNALWSYWLVWRNGGWVPSSPPEATTLPGARTNPAAAFFLRRKGFSGVPHVQC